MMNFIMKEIKNLLEIYTDGSTRNNGRKNSEGGWAYVIVNNGELESYDSGMATSTTNQKMELTAAIKACEFICPDINNPSSILDNVIIYSDSAYLINCYNLNWWGKWELNGWINSKKEPVANKKLWEKLIPYFKNNIFHFLKVQGHSGIKYNEMADRLAKGGTF